MGTELQIINIVHSVVCGLIKSCVLFPVLYLLMYSIVFKLHARNYKINRVVAFYFLRPVRSVIPGELKKMPYDITPLVSSILLILLGFGLCALTDIFSLGIISCINYL